MDDLKDLQRLVNMLEKTNSSNDKKEILKRFPQCKRILNYTYNSFKNYYVTSTNLQKMEGLLDPPSFRTNNLYDLLDSLDQRKITGYSALSSVWDFIDNQDPNLQDLIFRILDRNLKVRIDDSIINKVFPGCIPTFDVALANKFDDQANKVDFQKDLWFASHKLDGVRVITMIDGNGNISFWSRKGKQFTTLSKIENELKSLNLKNIVLDGEMCIVDKNGKEDFNSMIKLIRKKDFTVPNPKYKLFDLLHLDVFLSRKGGPRLQQRIEALKQLLPQSIFWDILEQKPITSIDFLNHLMDEAQEKGWEGLIIRKNTPYEGKRSNNMLKMKKFQDAEYKVEDAIMGTIQFIDNGQQKEEEMLSAITIRHKGYPVSVGSGFTIKFRQEAYNDSAKIVGKTVKVRYFEETSNKQGTISLRFPTVVHVYENGRFD